MDGDLSCTQQELCLDNPYFSESSFKQEQIEKNFSQGLNQGAQTNNPTKRMKKNLENIEVAALYAKKANLQQFIDLIGDHSTQPIRHDILSHCQKVCINIPSTLSRETVMKLVKNRVEKMIKNKRVKKNWSEEDLKILVWVVSKYCQYHGISAVKESMTEADWNNIANLIPGVTGKSCMFKWLSLKKNNLADNSWVEEESLLLDQMVKKHGENNWCRVSEELFLKNCLPNKIYRCPKQCREHWNCYLNPQLKKGPWQKKEDYLLVRAVMELEGVKKWAEIVKMFNGRTENALKNRFNLIVQKQMKEAKKYRKPSELEIIAGYLQKHENQFQVDQDTLRFLTEKKNHYSEIQAKKNPKKRPSKRVKNMKSLSEEDDYVPHDGTRPSLREIRIIRGTQSSRELQQKQYEQKKQQFYCKNESIIGSLISSHKNEPIFEYDDQQSIKLQQIKQEKPQPQWSPRQMFQIEPTGVFFVPFSEELLRKIQNENYNHGLIPCKLTEFNTIVEFTLQG